MLRDHEVLVWREDVGRVKYKEVKRRDVERL
jgi:hypothetical protein